MFQLFTRAHPEYTFQARFNRSSRKFANTPDASTHHFVNPFNISELKYERIRMMKNFTTQVFKIYTCWKDVVNEQAHIPIPIVK